MAWVLHAMTVVVSSNVLSAVQPSARMMPPETATPGSMLVVGSVTTDGCAVVSESSPQAAKAANARAMTIARKKLFFTSVPFDEDFHLIQ